MRDGPGRRSISSSTVGAGELLAGVGGDDLRRLGGGAAVCCRRRLGCRGFAAACSLPAGSTRSRGATADSRTGRCDGVRIGARTHSPAPPQEVNFAAGPTRAMPSRRRRRGQGERDAGARRPTRRRRRRAATPCGSGRTPGGARRAPRTPTPMQMAAGGQRAARADPPARSARTSSTPSTRYSMKCAILRIDRVERRRGAARADAPREQGVQDRQEDAAGVLAGEPAGRERAR